MLLLHVVEEVQTGALDFNVDDDNLHIIHKCHMISRRILMSLHNEISAYALLTP